MRKWTLAAATTVALLLTTQSIYASTDFAQTMQEAERGNPNAQNNLGLMYYIGRGVRQDYVQARHWYEEAANQGDASAQIGLGLLYENGMGGRQDYAQARHWYEKAASQGDADAQRYLDAMNGH